MKLIYAIAAHEHVKSLLDLISDIKKLDPNSEILVYDGSKKGKLFDEDEVEIRKMATIHPKSSAISWGRLHRFSMDCIKLNISTDYDMMIFIDSDQYVIRPNLSRYLDKIEHPRETLIVTDDSRQDNRSLIEPVINAYQETELWFDLFSGLPNGISSFIHWTFWPGTVIGKDIGEKILEVFISEKFKYAIRRSRIWASEEILIPSIGHALGGRVVRQPFSNDWNVYKAFWSKEDVKNAFKCDTAFLIHPILRSQDDEIRKYIRERVRIYF